MDAYALQFDVGRFRCASLVDGALNYPPASMLASLADDQRAAELRARGLPEDRIETPYTCMFIDTGAHAVVIDTGAGALGSMAPRVFPGIDHTTSRTGLLLASLALLGVRPGDVDTVIITHAHPDHVGGTLGEDGRPVFAAARYVVPRTEWDFWMADGVRARANPLFVDIAQRNLGPVREHVELVDDGDEVLPGISVVATPGHTPGHIALAVESAGARLLHISDAVLHPLLAEHPDWRSSFDMDPELADTSKRMILSRAAREQALVFAHHFPPYPSIGHVRRLNGGWQWRPLLIAAPEAAT